MARGKLVKNKVVLEDGPVVSEQGVSEIKEDNENTVAEGLRQTKNRYPGNWIKATDEEVKKYSEQGRIFGHDPNAGEVLIDVNKKYIEEEV